MFKLRKDADFKDINFNVYDFLHKYGFSDGDRILKEEKEIAEHLCHRLANEIGVVDNRWEPVVISAAPHNPYYISFNDLQTGELVNYYDLEERERRKIEQRLDEIRERS
jgi:hypothetical protein